MPGPTCSGGWPWLAEETLDEHHQEKITLPMPELLKWPPAENTGRGSLLNCPSCLPGNPIGQGVVERVINVRYYYYYYVTELN